MADRVSKEQRSANMQRIKGQDTRPELRVRKLLHAMGYRYRLHRKDLPGKPDVVFATRRKVIFIHGCFWHQHRDCAAGRMPASNLEYWEPKLRRNLTRDDEARTALQLAGWTVLVIWDCETKNLEELSARLNTFLRS